MHFELSLSSSGQYIVIPMQDPDWLQSDNNKKDEDSATITALWQLLVPEHVIVHSLFSGQIIMESAQDSSVIQDK